MILVTGATGNAGGEVARTLADAGQRMRPRPASAVRQRSRRGCRRWPLLVAAATHPAMAAPGVAGSRRSGAVGRL